MELMWKDLNYFYENSIVGVRQGLQYASRFLSFYILTGEICKSYVFYKLW